MFQDFNKEVLDKITRSYIEELEENNQIELSNNYALMDGDWNTFSENLKNGNYISNNKTPYENGKFDIMLLADTLYNIDCYEKIYNIVDNHLNNPGVCFICSKKFYFGVGGGTSDFIDYVANKGKFNITVAKQFNDG